MRGLSGQTVLLTGAAGGIGGAIAERLVEAGCAVALLDRSEAVAERAEALSAGGRTLALVADISDEAAVRSAVERCERELGPVSGLVNNAGWDRAGSFAESEPELWRRVVDINLYGPLNVTRRVLPGMLSRGAGRVVFMASDAARVGSSGEAVYAACKGGIVAFAKSVAREVARQGITLNAVCPGPTDTPLLAGVDESGRLQQALARAIPMCRLGRPEDLPGIVLFLLSDDAAFITGQTISVSGGLTMA